MTSMARRFTRQRTVLGVGVGKQRTDWNKIGKAGAAGVGAASAAAAGVGASQRGLFGTVRDAGQPRDPSTRAVPGRDTAVSNVVFVLGRRVVGQHE
jgi:hypothetical protein